MKQLCDRCPVSVASVCPIVIDGYYSDNGCPICGSQELANCGYECKVRYCEGCGSNLFFSGVINEKGNNRPRC